MTAMETSYPFPMYSGILEPEHYKKIDNAIWLFLWCVSSTTKEVEREGVRWGVVLGNKPIKIDEIADQFGVHRSTIKRWIEVLETEGYIRVTRAPYGLIFTVRNSKKFMSKDGLSGQIENGPSDPDRSNMNHPDGSEMVHQGCKNGPSNKDITKIYNTAAVVRDESVLNRLAHEVEIHFCQLKGSGEMVSPTDFQQIKDSLADGIPVEFMKSSFARSFETYKPKHRMDKIRNVAYCIPRCYDEWTKMQPGSVRAEAPITHPVPSGTVALGGHRTLSSKNAKAFQMLKEARDREQVGNY